MRGKEELTRGLRRSCPQASLPAPGRSDSDQAGVLAATTSIDVKRRRSDPGHHRCRMRQSARPAAAMPVPRRVGVLDPWPCFQSLCVRFPCVADAALRALANRRRLTARVGLGRSRAAGRQAPRPACPSRSCSPRSRMTAARRAAIRVARRAAHGSVRPDKSRWAVARLARADTAVAGGLGVRRPGRVTANTVTVRDSKRFAEPLALPRSCPPYVRDQWISRTHDRILWRPAPSARTCSRCRSGGIFSQVSTA